MAVTPQCSTDFGTVEMIRKITLIMKIEFDLNRAFEWQFHPAVLDKGSNF